MYVLPLVALFYAAGIALAGRWEVPLSLQAAIAALFFVVALASFRFGNRAAWLLPALFLPLGMIGFSLAERAIHSPLHPLLGREVSLGGYIHQVEEVTAGSAAFLLRVEAAAIPGGAEEAARALVRVRVWRPPLGFDPEYGRRLRVTGRLEAAPGRRNPGGFDYASFLETAGVAAVVSLRGSDLEILPGTGGLPWLLAAARARRNVMGSLAKWLPAPEAGLAAGLLLGEKSLTPGYLTGAYRTLGIAHLLAVSGLHTGFVAAFALWLARRVRGERLAWAVAAVFVLAYVLLTGGRPPVWRAAVMLWLALAARSFGRESDGLQGLAAAAMILLIFRPHWLFSLSFQFSFAAALGILTLTPRLEPLFRRLPSYLARPAAVALSAQLALLPLQVNVFSLLPVLAILANLLFVPLVGLFMGLGLAGIAASLLWAPFAAPFFLASLPLLKILEYLPRQLARLPLVAVQVPPLPAAVWVLYCIALVLFVARFRVLWSRARVAVAVLLVLNLIVFCPLVGVAARTLEVTFLDVGQGLAVFIRTPAGKAVLVDAGGNREGSFDPGERVVLPYLRARRVRTLDLLILTHPHRDHYGGMKAVVENLRVRLFVGNGEMDDSPAFEELAAALARAGVPVLALGAGERIVLDRQTAVDVLSPPLHKFRGTVDDANNNSLVLRLVHRGSSLLITGDAEKEAQAWLLLENPAALQSDVLQVPHHGSRSALSEEFLQAVGARAAVISVGKNTFGHPHAEVLELLANHGVTLFRTDLHGAITFKAVGEGWHARTFLIERPQMDILRRAVISFGVVK